MSDQPSDHPSSTDADVDTTRRGFMQSTLLVIGATQLPAHAAPPRAAAAAGVPPRPLTLNINGKDQTLSLEPRVTLLDALRESAGLTGTKKGCDRGQCGACTVLVDGRRINACLTLAIMHRGAKITTIEGIARGDDLAPIQTAFMQHDAFQCGYCTPGQICSAVACIDEIRAGTASAVTPDVREQKISFTDPEIRERMSGNLCRCGAYNNIVAAIRTTANV
ncbi:2Fe-2S iron-sulfur cluster-binding protein [Massilia phyllosphaerae]|uniref:2Fe-2S iron-sulfur cluster-binding protein n=1 Tax=Massilia phyllosphaerae TaxID=3106034 RepID=UPI002B1CDCD8|nr:2Fe-2S iron-sulfur cluster-binding protein [Massilia sp. SGZ-792]